MNSPFKRNPYGRLVSVEANLANEIEKKNLDKKNKALIISCSYPAYSLDWIRQLNENGFTVKLTTWVKFTQNVDEFINTYEILLFSSMSDAIPYDSPVTTASVVAAMTKWKKSGNKYIYLTENTTYKIKRYNLDGTEAESTTYYAADWYATDSAICDMYSTSFTGNEAYTFVNNTANNLLISGRKPVGNGRKWNTLKTGLSTLVSYNDGTTDYPLVIYRPGKHAFIANSGNVSNDYDVSGYFVYVDIGKVAKLLTRSVLDTEFAYDRMYCKKVVASGIDGDITDEPIGVKAIADAYGAVPLEFSLVAAKMTEALAEKYKMYRIELNSHSSTHYTTNLATVVETLTIGSNGIVELAHNCRIGISYVKDSTETTTYTAVSSFDAAVTTAQYAFDSHYKLKFHASLAGQQVKVSYSYLKEAAEWMGSLKTLADLGALTNESIYLTAGYTALNGATYAYAQNKEIALCEHFHTNELKRNDFLLYSYPGSVMTPLLQNYIKDDTAFLNDCGFDYYIRHYTKDAAKTAFEAKLPSLISNHRPLTFYTHDFWYSETAENSVWVDTSIGGDWKRSTYAETVAYVSDFLKWYIGKLSLSDVHWFTRSQWAKRYNYITDCLAYDVETVDSKTIITVRNNGKKQLSGVTFRTLKSITSAVCYPLGNVLTKTSGTEKYISVDLAAGEVKVITIT